MSSHSSNYFLFFHHQGQWCSSCWLSKSEEEYYVCFDIVRAWFLTLVKHNSIGLSIVEAGREEIRISERSTSWKFDVINRDNYNNNLHSLFGRQQWLDSFFWIDGTLRCVVVGVRVEKTTTSASISFAHGSWPWSSIIPLAQFLSTNETKFFLLVT